MRRREAAAKNNIQTLLLPLLLLQLLLCHIQAQPSYSNVTLKANNGDLEVVVYLPKGIKPNERTYYVSTRFDHGSMIGSIKRTTTKKDGTKSTHVLYDTNQWRIPHDPFWAESGVGLASEFGVGDDGGFCTFLCGWDQVNEVTNGVLGYQEAKAGESFLKIGVGELIKGSCNLCDSTDDYRFNSPYQFAKTPVWTLQENPEGNTITLVHEASLNQHGYRLQKDITLVDDQLFVKSILTNLGREPFATAWYSHHFFTCDGDPVGSGYGVDLDVAGTGGQYDEPAAWFWSTPLEKYASVTPKKDKVSVEMQRGVERDVRIKAEFVKDDTSRGTFTVRGCGNSIKESIPEIGNKGQAVSMYAFNLYIETGTFSPEPQIYMHLYPGETRSWTQHLEFSDQEEPPSKKKLSWFGRLTKTMQNPASSSSSSQQGGHPHLVFLASILISATVTMAMHAVWTKRRSGNKGYSSIPEVVS
mmetsp:Transcript_2710/g.6350  ORF Transcript_2710/g.6350 Transcript_2710/m.6350 type:complete len:471 (-) Transcript_2710:54-1466(-)